MKELQKIAAYRQWLIGLKSSIQKSQIKAAISVNSQLIMLYWNLGKEIIEKQEKAAWGSGFIDQLSKDLKNEFPEMGGFSKRNLEFIKQWVGFYNSENLNTKQLVSQLNKNKKQFPKQVVSEIEDTNKKDEIESYFFTIPWGHHILIIQKIKSIAIAKFYIQQTIKNNWSRNILGFQIESELHNRQGKAVNNFKTTLPQPQSDLANQLLKDPYNFDFLCLTQAYNERDIENALTENITKFLLELGKGFAFVGKQYLLKLGEKDYYIDLLFYHLKLRCYVVIELKAVDFDSAFTGKVNFYLNVINKEIKDKTDNPTIGIIICKNKNIIEAEYALEGINNPIGISEYEFNKLLPENYKGSLPTIEDIEFELNKTDNK